MNVIKIYSQLTARASVFTTCFLILLAVVSLVGCSKNATEPAPQDSSNILNESNGGFTTTSEAPGFGDPLLTIDAAGEVEYADPFATASDVDSQLVHPMAGVYHIRILWGHLEFDSTELDVTDWSGSLTSTRGCEVLRRVIRFEEGDVILPRTDRKRIEWVSHTRPHNDGIAVDLVIPPPKPIIDTEYVWIIDSVLGDSSYEVNIDTAWPQPLPVNVTFQTGPYSRTFSLEELARLDTIVTLEDGNEVSFTAFKFERFDCPKGFLGGRWGNDDSGNGVFAGTWIDRNGPSGHVRGRWGTNDAGENVFFGKWISENGEFEGLLRGKWMPHPNEHADSTAFEHAGGWFAGKIFDAADIEIGVLRGLFRTHPEEKAGAFMGRWKLLCRGGVHDDPRPPVEDGMRQGM
ncbi:MAG: hypothetical protein AAB305_01255 [Candidatus Zixiibacteriota bacterium]